MSGIRSHRQLLHDLLEKVPALREQPPLCRDAEGAGVRAASAGWPLIEPPHGPALEVGHPTIVGNDGARLDLYPMLHVRWDGGVPALAMVPDQSRPRLKEGPVRVHEKPSCPAYTRTSEESCRE